MKVIVVVLLVIMVLALALFAYKNTSGKLPGIISTEEDNGKKGKKKKGKESVSIEVEKKWDMPDILSEISDITYLDQNRFACVQDEVGKIFIYNTADQKIEKEYEFAPFGDYEGIAIVENIAYVVNSGGVIFEVSGINDGNISVKEYKTYLTEKDDVEALCYDKENNRLLLAFKGDEGSGNIKGIYSFDLAKKVLAPDPVLLIDLEDVVLEEKKKNGIKPSAIAIHPLTGHIYILEGTNPKLLVIDKQAKVKSLTALKGKEFEQPEGITFSPQGTMFISNEGRKEPGNILQIKQ